MKFLRFPCDSRNTKYFFQYINIPAYSSLFEKGVYWQNLKWYNQH